MLFIVYLRAGILQSGDTFVPLSLPAVNIAIELLGIAALPENAFHEGFIIGATAAYFGVEF